MNLLIQRLSKSQIFIRIFIEQPPTNLTNQDPLIDKSLETWQYIGVFSLAILSIFIVKLLSPKIEHTLLFAATLSVVLIVFFLAI